MVITVLLIFAAALAGLAMVTIIWGWQGALGGYLAGLITAGLIWPGLMVFAAVRFGPGSAAFGYAADQGRLSSLSVGGSWAVCALPVMALTLLGMAAVRLIQRR